MRSTASRFALPQAHAWPSQDQPVRLVEQAWRKDDPDPKALACYGMLWQQGAPEDPDRSETLAAVRHRAASQCQHHAVLGVVL